MERLNGVLREPVVAHDEVVARLKAAIRDSRPTDSHPGRAWNVRPALAFTVGVLIALGFLLGRLTAPPAALPGAGAGAGVSTPTTVPFQFVLVAEDARVVHVVGDFNEWEAAATPMTPSGGSGVWSVEVQLPPGRHEYAFLVDGSQWVPDANAPRSSADDFGISNSVLLVQAEQQ